MSLCSARWGLSSVRAQLWIDLHRHRHEGIGFGEEAGAIYSDRRVRRLGGAGLCNPRNVPNDVAGWSPPGYFVPAAILFGLGPHVNGACVFGSVGHFGNGDIEFGFAFLGIFAVVYVESPFGPFPDQPPISATLPFGQVLLVIALLAILALRLGVSFRSESNFRRLTLSMGAIGITFTILAVLAPGFSITASVGSIVSIPVAGAVISVCMFGGSLVSASFRKRRFMLKWPTIKTIVGERLGVSLWDWVRYSFPVATIHC